jgi:CHASE2 domain-containing sensor protein
MNEILEYLVVIGMAIAVSAATALLKERGAFSKNVFLSSLAISICILIWIPLVPMYMILVVALIMLVMLLGTGSDASE